MSKTQIRWTSREWQLIAERLATNCVIPSERGWRTHLVAAMKAVLPKERWREPECLNDVKKKLIPLMKVAAQTTILPMPIKEPKATLPQPVALDNLSTEDLIAEVVKRAVAGIAEQIKIQLAPRMFTASERQMFDLSQGRPARRHDPEGQHQTRNKLPVVLVIGPRNGQQKELRDTHGKWLDLRFVASEENSAVVKFVGNDANHVILWTDFISHTHQDQAKKLNAKLHYVTGGMTALHDKLKEITG